jgi:replication-associated recombination protein RarA
MPPSKRTVNGHDQFEAVSALQKAIRRGQTDDAIYWAVDLDLSGFGQWVWTRLLIITSEDVGPAWLEGPAVIRSLYESWKETRKRPNSPAAIFLVHAVIVLARAPKTRVVDHAGTVHYLAHPDLRREVPDEALDKHTRRGKQMGRGIDHFLDEAAKVTNRVEFPGEAQYREAERSLLKSGHTSSRPSDGNRHLSDQLDLG